MCAGDQRFRGPPFYLAELQAQNRRILDLNQWRLWGLSG